MGDVLCVLSKVQVSQIDEDGIWPSPLQRAVAVCSGLGTKTVISEHQKVTRQCVHSLAAVFNFNTS